MKLTRRMARWSVVPIVASALAVGGVAVAANAWHASQNITAAGQAGVVKPVIATATLEDVYPGQPIKYDVHFVNPNNFPVNVLTLQATDVTFTDLAVYPVTVDPTFTQHRSYAPLWAMPATEFDWVGSAAVAPGSSHQTLTGGNADVTWASALKQGSPISLDFWVDEAAF
jgi:hypothetical protein